MREKCEKIYKEWLKYCYNIDKKKDPFHICNKLLYDFSNCLLENVKK